MFFGVPLSALKCRPVSAVPDGTVHSSSPRPTTEVAGYSHRVPDGTRRTPHTYTDRPRISCCLRKCHCPGRGARALDDRERSHASGTPPGCCPNKPATGGVAALNHRLSSSMPPAWPAPLAGMRWAMKGLRTPTRSRESRPKPRSIPLDASIYHLKTPRRNMNIQ
jgi:hypothetical protein